MSKRIVIMDEKDYNKLVNIWKDNPSEKVNIQLKYQSRIVECGDMNIVINEMKSFILQLNMNQKKDNLNTKGKIMMPQVEKAITLLQKVQEIYKPETGKEEK